MSVNVDETGEVWLRWRAEGWDEAMELLDALDAGSYFPPGWTPFTARVNKRPIGKGAAVTVVIGYRRTSEQIPRLTHAEAGAIYEVIQEEIAATKELRDLSPEAPPAA